MALHGGEIIKPTKYNSSGIQKWCRKRRGNWLRSALVLVFLVLTNIGAHWPNVWLTHSCKNVIHHAFYKQTRLPSSEERMVWGEKFRVALSTTRINPDYVGNKMKADQSYYRIGWGNTLYTEPFFPLGPHLQKFFKL